MDFLLVFQWLMLHKDMTSRNYYLFVVCRELLSQEWRVELLHVTKEPNQVADGVALVLTVVSRLGSM